jgi:hypothetical protein
MEGSGSKSNAKSTIVVSNRLHLGYANAKSFSAQFQRRKGLDDDDFDI